MIVPPGKVARLARIALALALAGLGLAGCVSSKGLAPSAQPLDVSAAATDTAFHAWPDEHWWTVYRDASLNELIEHALAASPSLEKARARIAMAEAAIGFTHGRLLPEVTFAVDSTYQRYPEHGQNRNLGGEGGSDNAIEFHGTYELDFFGRNQAALAAATSNARASAAAQQAVRLSVASTVAQAYFVLARQLAERQVVADTRRQREKILTLVQARVAEGIDSNVELRQAEGALPDIDGQLALLDENIELMRSRLAELAVVPLEKTARLAPALKDVAAPTLPASIPSDLLARRADITAARWEIEATLRGTEMVKAEFYPSVNLTAFAGIASLGLSSLFEAGSGTLGVNPTLSLPIFDGDRLRSKLKFADAEVDRAIAEYNGTLLDALRDVVHAVTSLRALEHRQAAQRAAQASAESAYDLALQRYKAGLTGYLTVLATETEVLSQRRAATELKARALDLNVALNRALGGGFDAATVTASN
ncbi:MAG: efflux transporter outer membrane subunit [Proteobacteria bacterium]|nr:efflux transporter outer membrane subunit [Pseudomonadota bacterium]